MHVATKRHWLRFSLRTMFVLLTALTVWLGWNVQVVRQRKALLQELRAMPSVDVWTPESCIEPDERSRPDGMSRLRYLLGDELVESIDIRETQSESVDSLMRRAAAVFPDAGLYRDDP